MTRAELLDRIVADDRHPWAPLYLTSVELALLGGPCYVLTHHSFSKGHARFARVRRLPGLVEGMYVAVVEHGVQPPV